VLTLYIKMTGIDKRERILVKGESVVAEALAEMKGVTKEFMLKKFNVVYKGKMLNLRSTIEKARIEDQDFLVIVPKLKGGLREVDGSNPQHNPTSPKD